MDEIRDKIDEMQQRLANELKARQLQKPSCPKCGNQWLHWKHDGIKSKPMCSACGWESN